MSQLRGVGQGAAIAGDVLDQAQSGYESLQAAQVALANADFEASEEQFLNARQQLVEARMQVDGALGYSRKILEVADVTGSVKTGSNMLAMAEELALVGESLASVNFDGNIVDVLERLTPKLGRVHESLLRTEDLMDGVKVEALPESVRDDFGKLEKALPRITEAVGGYVQESDRVLAALGAYHDKKYLLLFQNNHEVRPTGGFIGSIALVNVRRGEVEDIDVSTVYDPDGQLKEYIAPPEPLRAITDRWYMRDANWFVDFPVSAKKVSGFFEKEGGATVDGVIAITPDVIQYLLRVTGPIDMPAYGVEVDADNFVEVTQNQVTYAYDKELNKPKQFLSDLTPILLNRLLAQDADYLELMSAVAEATHERSILMYLADEDLQAGVEQLGWAGKLPDSDKVDNFLYVNNANIGGHKSDQFMDQEVDYRLDVSEENVEVTLTVRREHNGPVENRTDLEYPENENPAFKDNVIYQRVLVPESAELLEARGFTPTAEVPRPLQFTNQDIELNPDKDVALWQQQDRHASGTEVGEEAGYRYFGNWIITQPGETTVAMYRYVVPRDSGYLDVLKRSQSVSAYVYKQPGVERNTLRVDMRVPDDYDVVHYVSKDGVTDVGDGEVVYRGELNHDKVVGVVLEKR